jgi:hypothetical protein
VREHHRVDQPEPTGQRHCREIRGCRAQAGDKEDRPDGGDADVEPFTQPERQQGVDDETPTEGVNREQGRQAVDDPA